MRFISKPTSGYKIYAVSGINSVSFAIDFDQADTKGLLGFAVERHDITEGERYFMYGFKVFKDMIPDPGEDTAVSTYDHPVQSFVWDDFTAKPNHKYEYFFYPLKGKPGVIDRSAKAVAIEVQTEPLYDPDGKHDVFFNRGVASSQAFARKFQGSLPGSAASHAKNQKMRNWLARDLEKSLLKFIAQAKPCDTLLVCAYEFHYLPVLEELKKALQRGVRVHVIIDAKKNAEGYPRDINLAAIEKAGLPEEVIVKREARQSNIQHNKFIVLLRGVMGKPTAVWTGSTNISEGGIFGQTNVGHWVRDPETAKRFAHYWQLLSLDPGGHEADSVAEKASKNRALKVGVEALQKDVDAASLPVGITPIFSPRLSGKMLRNYATLLDSASNYSAITLAFGISDIFKQVLADNTAKSHITFMLLEKKDAPRGNADVFTRLTAGHNVYEAWGSYIHNPLYQWAREINTKMLGLNQHVAYIHSKFMLVDPLGAQPIVVTGSANFSQASTVNNDENMLLIKGDKRAADIYFTEFNRLFNHYYFRSVYESQAGHGTATQAGDSLFLAPNDSWLAKYAPGKLRYKRVKMFTKLEK